MLCRKKVKAKAFSLILVAISCAIAANASADIERILPSSGKIVYQQILVDFSKTVGTVNTYFGVQSNGAAILDSDFQTELRTLRPAYVRDGVVCDGLVYPPNSSVNDWYWKRLSSSLSYVSSIGAKVLFTLNGAPANLCENGQFGNPIRIDCYNQTAEWYAYFLLQVKNLGYDVKQFFWEVWNEPRPPAFSCVEDYVNFYNIVENKIHLVDPDVKLGTAFSYFSPSRTMNPWINYTVHNVNSIQFLGWHQYGGYENHDNDTIMSWTKALFEDETKLAEQFRNTVPKLANATLIISEFNVNPNDGIAAGDYIWGHQTSDNSTDDRARDVFSCAWCASALNHMIKSKVYVASFFRAYGYKWGMFYENSQNQTVEFPVFKTEVLFSQYITYGSDIVSSSSTRDPMIEVLAVKGSSKIVVIINKNGYDTSVALNASGFTQFFDLQNNRYVDANCITLTKYAAVFLRVQ